MYKKKTRLLKKTEGIKRGGKKTDLKKNRKEKAIIKRKGRGSCGMKFLNMYN